MTKILAYNSVMSMTSLPINSIIMAPGASFKIQGEMRHSVGPIIAADGTDARCMQIYFTGNRSYQIQRRMDIFNHGLCPNTIDILMRCLRRVYAYVHVYSNILDQELPEFNLRMLDDLCPAGEHRGRFNAPTHNDEIAVIYDTDKVRFRDQILNLKSGGVRKLSELNSCVDSLGYPLCLPYGTATYSPDLKRRTGVTMRQYYLFQFQARTGNRVIKLRRLYQKCLTDVYCKIEIERLNYHRRLCDRLRSKKYNVLLEHAALNDVNVGRGTILSASYQGGKLWLAQKRQDALCYVQYYGNPTIFLTLTTNPEWPEIVDNLLPGETAIDRPMLTNKVFELKHKHLIHLLENGYFG